MWKTGNPRVVGVKCSCAKSRAMASLVRLGLRPLKRFVHQSIGNHGTDGSYVTFQQFSGNL